MSHSEIEKSGPEPSRGPWQTLVPPSGGLEGLRRKLDATEDVTKGKHRDIKSPWRPAFGHFPAYLSAVLLLLLGIYYLPDIYRQSDPYAHLDPELANAFKARIEPASTGSVRLIGPAGEELPLKAVPSQNQNVEFYWIDPS